jgi:hypothetical protein
MKKTRKKFDAVETMRQIRDRLSNEVEGMTFEEEKRFIRKGGAVSDPHRPRLSVRPAPHPMSLRSGGRVREQA